MSVPVNENENSLNKVLYAEAWCLNESLWRTYINNAFKEIEIEDPGSSSVGRKTRMSRLKVSTQIHGENILGTVKWIASDVDIDSLDRAIKVNNDNMFEKGLYFMEPFWTTAIFPHLITKALTVNID
jgi:hypothetical protein